MSLLSRIWRSLSRGDQSRVTLRRRGTGIQKKQRYDKGRILIFKHHDGRLGGFNDLNIRRLNSSHGKKGRFQHSAVLMRQYTLMDAHSHS